MRFFNTAVPPNCQKHYCVPPLTRFSLDDILGMIDRTPNKPWEEKIFQRKEHHHGVTITVWGM